MTTESPFKLVGIMEANPHKMIIRFRDNPERLIIEKKDFSELIRGLRDEITVASRDMSQAVLFGEIPSNYAGKAEVTRSGKAVRLNLKDDRTLYLSMKGAMDVLERREYSCSISEVAG